MKDYASYSSKDFILDKHFQQWVISPDPESKRFWESWLKAHPGKQQEVLEASAFIQSMPFNFYTLGAKEQAHMWSGIQERLQHGVAAQADAEGMKKPSGFVRHRRWMAYAAAILLLLVSWLIYRPSADPYIRYQTGYGENKEIRLPDGSRVVLNANSSLRFGQTWKEQREVWVEGEAFFEVREITTAPDGHHNRHLVKFIVHTSQVDVEVVGTSFNVKDRRGSTEVVLNTGKILLENDGKKLEMLPGEIARVAAGQKDLSKHTVNPDFFVSWKEHRFVFYHTSIREIAEMLEDTYGYEVQLDDKEISHKKLTSTVSVSTENMEVFLAMVEKLYRVDIRFDKTKNLVQIGRQELGP